MSPSSTAHAPGLPVGLFLAFCLLLCAVPAHAQQGQPQQGQPQQGGGEPGLPDIAPREVEIRGKLEISFPSLERPAPTGLLPPTRLPPLPPLPAPGVQDVAPGAAPQTLPGRAEAPSGFAETPPPQTGLIEVGGGRYFSRFARARLDLPLAPRWALRSRLDYDGTDGFQPFDGQDTHTPFDDLHASATLRTERDALSASLTADGFLGQHQLYGAERVARPSATAALAPPSRDRYGGGAALHLRAGDHVEARALYDGAQVQTDVFDSSDDDGRFERGEQRAGGALKVHTLLGDGLRAEADAHASTARLSGGASRADSSNTSFGGTASFLDAGAGVWLLQNSAYRLFAGARVLTFSSETGGGTYVAPHLELEWEAAPRLTLYARTHPRAEANRLAERYRENPSLLYENAPQPVVRTLDAEGGLRFFPYPTLAVRAFAGYQRAPSFLFYEAPRADAPSPYPRGVTAAHYGAARILRAGGSVSFRHAERLNASLSIALREGHLAEGGATLPYFSPLTAEALLSYGFAEDKGRLQLTGSFESARPLRRDGEATVGAFADLDVEGRYAVTPAIGVVLRLENVPAGALERYDRYPRPPLVFETGLRVTL